MHESNIGLSLTEINEREGVKVFVTALSMIFLGLELWVFLDQGFGPLFLVGALGVVLDKISRLHAILFKLFGLIAWGGLSDLTLVVLSWTTRAWAKSPQGRKVLGEIIDWAYRIKP